MLREKFVIDSSGGSSKESMTVVSNRLTIPLLDDTGKTVQTLIVRGKFMHHVLRMGAFIIREFEAYGPLTKRPEPLNFKERWSKILSDFDHRHEPESWISLFEDGVSFFSSQNIHPFLDIIEQCDHQNPDDYDFAVAMAEEAFRNSGQSVKIDYAGTLAMVAAIKQDSGRCGLICRSPTETSTFNFMVEKDAKQDYAFKPIDMLIRSADFLEIIQLSFSVGIIEAKISLNLLEKSGKDSKKMKDALKRIESLRQMIDIFEDQYKVRYRPEKPNLKEIVRESKNRALKMLRA